MSAARRVAVAMSGGVDSSVAAALLVEEGTEVFGLMMRLWSEGPDRSNRCCSPADVATARQVAGQLEIPFHVLDVRARFKADVVDFFVGGYAQGVTPNPCLECNRHIRWGYLLDQALAMGATHLATGHYARVQKRRDRYALLRAVDERKDQSYVLSVMGQPELSHAVFPLGELTKDEVRAVARRFELPVAERRESQDLCFAGRSDYRTLLRQQIGASPKPGPIVDREGNLLGQHTGLMDFTIGQRKGLGVAADHPLYVLDKRAADQALVVGRRDQLGRSRFQIHRVNWVGGAAPLAPVEVSLRVRYKAREVAATVTPAGSDRAEIRLAETLPDVTPGQAAVFYHGDECLGGGIILP